MVAKKISIFFAGDFCSKPSTSQIIVSNELRNKIQSCDFKVVNFEVPLKPNDIKLPSQKRERYFQNDDAPNFLRGMGFNLFSMANNHAFDWGVAGYLKTKAFLGEDAFGAGTYENAYRVKVVEKNGVKIGFLAVCYAAYTGVFDDVANHEGLGCAYINDLRLNHDIIEAKKHVDYLFILPHDGIEYIDVPLPETIARFHDFIDYGADGVIGTHPHCPQGWEEYKGKPIFYSLGNFLFNSKDRYDYRVNDCPHWYEGLCVEMDLKAGKIDYRVFNTKNIGNLQIVIDKERIRIEHNQRLNNYLIDKKAYSTYLAEQCRRLTESQEMPIIDRTFHESTLKSCTKLILNKWIKKIKGKSVEDDFALKTLLRNDSRKNVLMRMIR